jgi:hypothetical protein
LVVSCAAGARFDFPANKQASISLYFLRQFFLFFYFYFILFFLTHNGNNEHNFFEGNIEWALLLM